MKSISLWISVMRPKTLSGAAAPVVVALAAAYHDGHWQWTPALLCLAFAMLMQMAANAINDLVDGLKGRDGANRLGPQRAMSAGLVTASQLKWAIGILVALAGICGLPLIWYGGPWMLAIGILCMAFCALYSTTLAQRGWGDVLVLVFFGLVPVMLTYYLQAGTVTLPVLLLSLGMGLATDTLLVVNNYRDIHEDAVNGKRTLCVWLGKRGSIVLYLLLGIAAAVSGIVALAQMGAQYAAMFGYAGFHCAACVALARMPHTPAMNKALGHASLCIIGYALAAVAQILFASLIHNS